MATIGKTLFAHFRQVLHASAQYDQAITVFHRLKKRLEVSNLCSFSWDQTVTFSDLAHGLCLWTDRSTTCDVAALFQRRCMQKFLLSAPRCCGFVTSCSQLKFVAVVGPGSESFATRVRRLFQLVLHVLALGRRNRKPKSCRTRADDRPSAGRSSFFLLLTRTVYNSPWRQFSQWLVGAMDTRESTQTGRTWGRPSTHRRSTTANRLSKFSFGERILSETDGSAIFMLRQGVAKTLYCNRLFFVFSKKP